MSDHHMSRVRFRMYNLSLVCLCSMLTGCPDNDPAPPVATNPTPTSFANQAYLKAPNAGAGDSFGNSVALDGDTLVVGASGEASNQTTITNGATASADNSASGAGAAYVFTRSGTTWSQQAYLKAPNAEAGDNFGNSVALNGNTLVVGASGEDSNQTTITNGATASPDNSASDAGAVYVFLGF